MTARKTASSAAYISESKSVDAAENREAPLGLPGAGVAAGGGAEEGEGSLTMMCMLSWPYAKFLMPNAARSVICGGADHVVSRRVGETSGGGSRVIVCVTVGVGPVTVIAVESRVETVTKTVVVDSGDEIELVLLGEGGEDDVAAGVVEIVAGGDWVEEL